MDASHVHLMLNHIPILGSIFAFILMVIGMILKNRTVEVVALSTLVLVAVITIPVYLSGEESEHTVEHIAGISEHDLEEHEEHAELTMWLFMAMGVEALLTLFAFRFLDKWSRATRTITLILALLAFLSSIPLAIHGGKIMHSEIRGAVQEKMNSHD